MYEKLLINKKAPKLSSTHTFKDNREDICCLLKGIWSFKTRYTHLNGQENAKVPRRYVSHAIGWFILVFFCHTNAPTGLIHLSSELIIDLWIHLQSHIKTCSSKGTDKQRWTRSHLQFSQKWLTDHLRAKFSTLTVFFRQHKFTYHVMIDILQNFTTSTSDQSMFIT